MNYPHINRALPADPSAWTQGWTLTKNSPKLRPRSDPAIDLWCTDDASACPALCARRLWLTDGKIWFRSNGRVALYPHFGRKIPTPKTR